MAIFNGKLWLRENLAEYLTVIKAKIAEVGDITGQLLGTSETLAGLPTTDAGGGAANTGDFAILSTDDGSNLAGIYVYDEAIPGYAFASGISSFSDVVSAIIATPAEVDAGTDAAKVANVVDLKAKYARINGDATKAFAVTAADVNSDYAINSNQMADIVTPAEAASDWATA